MIIVIELLTRVARRLTFGLLPTSLLSFLIVGSLGVVVHLGVLKLAMATWIHPFAWANLTAMLCAATFNYWANNTATFKDRSLSGRHVYVGYLCYLGITGLGLGLSMLISTRLYAAHGLPVLSALCGIVAGSLWNYGMSYTVVWKFLFNRAQQYG